MLGALATHCFGQRIIRLTEDCLFWTYNILLLLVMSKSKDMKVLARDKKTLAEDSLLPLHCGSASNCRAESRADYPPHSRVQHPTVAYFQPKTLSLVSPSIQDDTHPLLNVHCHMRPL